MLEFHEVVEWLQKQNQADGDGSPRAHARKYMYICSEPSNDADVAQLVRRRATGMLSSSPPSSPSSPSQQSAPPSSTYPIWTGFYFLDFQTPPASPKRGWAAGRLRTAKGLNDLVLTLSKASDVNIRQNHAVFQLNELGRIFVQRPEHAKAYAGDQLIPHKTLYLFNNRSTVVTFGELTYRFQYEEYSTSDNYQEHAAQYLKTHVGKPLSPLFARLPTPRDETIQIGDWTLSPKGTVGAGAFGRVDIGVSNDNQVVALKRMTINGYQDWKKAAKQEERLKIITRQAKEAGETRILQLLRVITNDDTRTNPIGDVWFVLKPAVPMTLLKVSSLGLLAGRPDA
jgi:hypothetical protein